MRTKVSQYSLIACLFLFLIVVIGGGLHLTAGGAFLAAATGTPLLIHVFHRWLTRGNGPDLRSRREGESAASETPTKRSRVCEVGDVVRQ